MGGGKDVQHVARMYSTTDTILLLYELCRHLNKVGIGSIESYTIMYDLLHHDKKQPIKHHTS